jgi:methylmalonyl-CoA epimerase
MIKGMSHIGILVSDIETTLDNFCQPLKFPVPPVKGVPERQMKVALLDLGNVSLEFIEDYSNDGNFAKIVRERGQTIHHLALSSDDIDADLAAIETGGNEQSDKLPKTGLRGKRIVFLEPELLGGITVELTEP